MLNEIRTKKYTMKEFKSLERNADGDLLNIYDHFVLLTDRQVSLLSGDDQSRYDELQEELRCEMAYIYKELGI